MRRSSGSDTHANTFSDSDRNSYANSDSYHNTHTNSDSYSNSNADGYTHGYSELHAEVSTHAAAAPDAGASTVMDAGLATESFRQTFISLIAR